MLTRRARRPLRRGRERAQQGVGNFLVLLEAIRDDAKRQRLGRSNGLLSRGPVGEHARELRDRRDPPAVGLSLGLDCQHARKASIDRGLPAVPTNPSALSATAARGSNGEATRQCRRCDGPTIPGRAWVRRAPLAWATAISGSARGAATSRSSVPRPTSSASPWAPALSPSRGWSAAALPFPQRASGASVGLPSFRPNPSDSAARRYVASRANTMDRSPVATCQPAGRRLTPPHFSYTCATSARAPSTTPCSPTLGRAERRPFLERHRSDAEACENGVDVLRAHRGRS